MIKLVDPSLCICHGVNDSKVCEYIDLLAAGVILPPGKAVEKDGKYIVMDGNHRTVAHARLGLDIYHDVESWEDVADQEIRLISSRL